MYNIVTSMTEGNLQRYGHEFLRTFREFWPKDVHLTVYWEGEDLRADEENIHWRYIEEVEGYNEWMDRITKFPFMTGIVGPNKYNIQYDARHVRKALIEMHGLMKFGGKVFWADSDIVTHAPVSLDFLDQILPDEKFCCYCGREGWMYSETGFIGFNADHPLFQTFRQLYLDCFFSGVIFTQKGWHDCYGFDLVRKALARPDAFSDLSGHLPPGVMHPIVNSVLGSVIDHRKGPRKESRSTKRDLVVERDEPYWQDDPE